MEGLLLKCQYLDQYSLMQRANSSEKTLMLGKIKGERRRGQQRMRWLDGITDFDMSSSKVWEIAKTWKQPECSWKKACIKEMWYVYTVEYYSSIKWNGIPLAATWLDLEMVIQSEGHQTEK